LKHRELAVAVMVFSMRLELARARALDGLQLGMCYDIFQAFDKVVTEKMTAFGLKEEVLDAYRTAGEVDLQSMLRVRYEWPAYVYILSSVTLSST
jgi:hypothetical protein